MLKQSFLWALLGKGALLLSGLLAAALINRALAPTGRGVLAEMQTWVGLFAVLFGLSLDTAIYHFANRHRFNIPDSAKLLLTLGMSICVAAIAVAGLAAFIGAFPEMVSLQAASSWGLLAALLALTILGTNLLTFGQAVGAVRLVAIISALQGATNLAMIGPAYLAGAIDIRFAMLAAIAVQSVGTVLALGALYRRVGLSPGEFSSANIWRFLFSGLKQHVSTVSTFIYAKINQLIVFGFSGEAEAGLMAAALTLALGLFGVFGAFQFALYPRVIHHEDDLEITVRSLRIAFYGGLLFVAPLLILARPLLNLYGGLEFENAAVMFRALVIGAWFLSMSSLGAPYYIKAGLFRIAALTAVLLGVVSIGLNLALVPGFGGVGASVATAITMALGFGITLWMLWSHARFNVLAVFKPAFGKEVLAIKSALLKR